MRAMKDAFLYGGVEEHISKMAEDDLRLGTPVAVAKMTVIVRGQVMERHVVAQEEEANLSEFLIENGADEIVITRGVING